MADKTVFERIAAITSELLGYPVADIKLETTLEDVGADSLDQVELIMAIEDEFEIEVPDEICERWTTVQQAVDYVTTHQPVNT